MCATPRPPRLSAPHQSSGLSLIPQLRGLADPLLLGYGWCAVSCRLESLNVWFHFSFSLTGGTLPTLLKSSDRAKPYVTVTACLWQNKSMPTFLHPKGLKLTYWCQILIFRIMKSWSIPITNAVHVEFVGSVPYSPKSTILFQKKQSWSRKFRSTTSPFRSERVSCGAASNLPLSTSGGCLVACGRVHSPLEFNLLLTSGGRARV